MEKPEIIRRSIEDSATGELSPSELFNKIVKNYFDDEDDSEDDNFDYNDFSVNFNEEAHSFVDGPSSSNRFYPNLKVFKKKLFKTLNLPSFKWTLRSSIQCEIQKEDRLKVFGVTSPQKLLQLMPPPSNELIDFKSRCVSPDLFSSHFNGDTNFVQSVQNALNAMKRNSKTNVAADSEKVMKKILQDLEENGAASISVVKNEEWENSEVSNGM